MSGHGHSAEGEAPYVEIFFFGLLGFLFLASLSNILVVAASGHH